MPRFEKGNQSGKGRPRRVLSRILEARGHKLKNRATTLGLMDVSDQEFVADKVWELITEGSVNLNGKIYEIYSLREWIGVVKFVYEQIDGKPVPESDNEIVVQILREKLPEEINDDATD